MARRSPSGRRWDELDKLRAEAFIVSGAFFVPFTLWRLASIVQAGRFSPEIAASLLALAMTLVLMLEWGWSTGKELGMLKEIGGGAIPPLPGSSFPLVMAAAIGFGALAAATLWPLTFAAAYLALRVIETAGYIGIRKTIEEGLARARAGRVEREREAALAAIEHYYVRRHWLRLESGGMVFAIAAGLVAAAAYAVDDPSLQEVMGAVAYITVVMATVLNDVVVGMWREARRKELPERYR